MSQFKCKQKSDIDISCKLWVIYSNNDTQQIKIWAFDSKIDFKPRD